MVGCAMGEGVRPAGLVRFGEFEVDIKAGEVLRQGHRLKLRGQPFEVLVTLLERPDEVVTRDELRSRLWPTDTFVDFDHSLNTAINKIREALGDSATQPQYIETLPRRGYRFIAPVERAGAESDKPENLLPLKSTVTQSPPVVKRSTFLRRFAWAAAVGVLVVIALDWAGALTVIGVRSFALRLLGEVPKLETRMTHRPLTSNPLGTPMTASAISPNGVYLAYADSGGLYLRRIQTGESSSLALPTGERVGRLSWFPDGSRLLVATWRPPSTTTLWSIAPAGGPARRLHDGAWAAAVSPDGSRIAFIAGKGGNELWTMGTQGEDPRRILSVEDSKGFGSVTWSPDNRRLAYIRYVFTPDKFTAAIETCDREGNGRTVLTEDRRLGGVPWPGLVWTRDGRIIHALGEPPPNQNDSNLWEIPVDNATGASTGPRRRLTQWAGFSFSQLSPTSDGQRLSFLKVSFQPDVYVARWDAKRAAMGNPQRTTFDDRADMPTAWTPDGRDVIFYSDRNGNWDIFKQALGSRLAEPVVATSDDEVLPRTSPDGKWILYWAVPPSDVGSAFLSPRSRLMRVAMSGGPPQRVLDWGSPSNFGCGAIPGARCVLGKQAGSRYVFYALDPVEGLGREITRMEIDPSMPVNWQISPDGKYVATLPKNSSLQGSIRVITLEDGKSWNLELPGWFGCAGIDWARDGNHVFVSAYSDQGEGLLLVNLHGQIRVVHRWSENEWGQYAIPSPDGRALAIVVYQAGESNAWLIENF